MDTKEPARRRRPQPSTRRTRSPRPHYTQHRRHAFKFAQHSGQVHTVAHANDDVQIGGILCCFIAHVDVGDMASAEASAAATRANTPLPLHTVITSWVSNKRTISSAHCTVKKRS